MARTTELSSSGRHQLASIYGQKNNKSHWKLQNSSSDCDLNAKSMKKEDFFLIALQKESAINNRQ